MIRHRALIAGAILAGGFGLGVSRRIGADVEIVTVPPDDTNVAKLEASRREWLRAQAAQREAARQREQHRVETRKHGSEREARRRRRQIERGQLKTENGLAR